MNLLGCHACEDREIQRSPSARLVGNPLSVVCLPRRFDIVLLLLDQHEAQWDSIVSEHVLANHQQVRDAHTHSVGACTAVWVVVIRPSLLQDSYTRAQSPVHAKYL